MNPPPVTYQLVHLLCNRLTSNCNDEIWIELLIISLETTETYCVYFEYLLSLDLAEAVNLVVADRNLDTGHVMATVARVGTAHENTGRRAFLEV